MKNRKSIMMVSGLLILFFHLWINVSGSTAEIFVKQIAYVGVDMFFFLSAYSLASRSTGRYRTFIWSRFKAVYIKYVIFACIAAIMGGWTVSRFVQVICGAELFTRGGGSFLWFLPAIMICYMLIPIYKLWESKNGAGFIPPLMVLIAWAALSAILTYAADYQKIFIFTNRLPIILIGYYAGKADIISTLNGSDTARKVFTAVSGIAFTAIGLVIAYHTGFMTKLQVPFTDMFYVTVIPLTLGLILLSSLIPEKRVMKWIGASTLELYAVQIVFGYKIGNLALRHFGVGTAGRLTADVVTFAAVVIISVVLHYGYEALTVRIKRENGKLKEMK